MNQKEKFISICKSEIRREGIEPLLDWLEQSDFFTAPASTRFHGNYEGGLCEHSLNVYEQLLKLYELYGNKSATRETLAIVALFHDVCKIDFYKKGFRNVKEDGEWKQLECWEIDEKLPLGHGEKSCLLLQQFIRLSVEEMLAIRWHMGGYDNAVKGGERGLAKAQEMSRLVTLLSVADIISSNILEKSI